MYGFAGQQNHQAAGESACYRNKLRNSEAPLHKVLPDFMSNDSVGYDEKERHHWRANSELPHESN
jgi:hypothetical protein